MIFPDFQNCACCENYLFLGIICSLKLTVFLKLQYPLGKLLASWEQIMSVDKYPRIFSRQLEAIVYISHVTPVVKTSVTSQSV